MRIPYRTRKLLLRIAIAALILVLLCVIICSCSVLWLDKYIYYTRDGAVLDMTMAPISQDGQLAVPPEKKAPVDIYLNEGDNAINTSQELTQLVGYYIDAQQLQDIPAVMQQLKSLPSGTPIMVDVKSIYGGYFYSSGVSTERDGSIDPKEMDKLITYLNSSGTYTIARMPALRDKAFGLENDEYGLFHSSRAYLWMDDQGCYWLNPNNEGTMGHLTRTVKELKGLGFNEVVLYDFCFPQTDSIYIGGDKTELITTAAKTLVDTCADDSFAVSFVGGVDFPLPEGRTRLYMQSAVASEAATIAAELNFETPEIHLVFITDNHDTRFNAYGVMRPLSSAH